MTIGTYGEYSVRITTKGESILINPHKEIRVQGGLAILSHPSIEYEKKDVFVIDGAGEYERNMVSVKGIREDDGNIIYHIEAEGISFAVLGSLESKTISNKAREIIQGSTVLIIPVAGKKLTSAEAWSLAVSLQATTVIPVEGASGKKGLDTFLKEVGNIVEKNSGEKTLKKKEMEGATRVLTFS